MAGAQEAGAPLVVKNCGSAACGSGAVSACVLELLAEARRERSGRCQALEDLRVDAHTHTGAGENKMGSENSKSG